MVSDFFTRETWRPGKKRRMYKRTKLWGGQKVAPPAFLEAAKHTQFRPGRPGARICTATKRAGGPCGRLALKGLNVCGAHGGYSALAKQDKLHHSERSAAARAFAVEGRCPPVPQELINLTLYRQASQWARIRLARAWGTPMWSVTIRQLKEQEI